MELKGTNKDNFWKNHTLNDFQISAIHKNVHISEITSVCFLKDGRIVSTSDDKFILIYNKNTFKIEIRINETKRICYMNVNKDGILICCLAGTFINLYEIKGKNYKIFQTIKPYSFLINIIGKFDDSFSIQKFIEIKNGNIALLVWGYALCFYEKNKKSLKYSYLNKYSENVTDLCEIDNNQYCIALKFNNLLQFLDMNLNQITATIQCSSFYFSESKNKLLLMNKKDLFLIGKYEIVLVDIKKKQKVKEIKFENIDIVSSIYKLTDNTIIIGYCNNYIEQLKYDEKKKEFKMVSRMGIKKFDSSVRNKVNSISIFNNDLIVAPYYNNYSDFSLIIYKFKNNK